MPPSERESIEPPDGRQLIGKYGMTSSPMNPVISPDLKELLGPITLPLAIEPGKPLDGCTGKKSTCKRESAPLCDACTKL